jgi:hypothetical protein
MLYHCNPWTDTDQGACSTFDLYLRDPINFFMTRFLGMTRAVAEFLAKSVFCVLDDPDDDSQRISAREFGLWVRNLPSLLGGHGMQRTVSNSSTQGYRLQVSTPLSHRPSSRHPSGSATTVRTPAIPPRSLSRAPSLGFAYEDPNELSTVLDQDEDDEQQPVQTVDVDVDDAASRSTSHQRRRKRGIRKGKGVTIASHSEDDTLTTLAGVTQNLVRELSKTSLVSSHRSVGTRTTTSTTSRTSRTIREPVAVYAVPTALLSARSRKQPPPKSESPAQPTAPVTKKPSKWKLTFGKASAVAQSIPPEHASSVEELTPTSIDPANPTTAMSSTATNVTNLIMGLNPTTSTQPAKAEGDSRMGGRRARGAFNENSIRPTGRNVSPNSTRSGRLLASSASSMASSNWRSSASTMSSVGASTSAFTRYSNSSTRSVSTAATSISSTSWRTSVKTTPINNSTMYPSLPKNIKGKFFTQVFLSFPLTFFFP